MFFIKLPGDDIVSSRLRITALEVWEQKCIAQGFQGYFSFMKTTGHVVRHASTYKIPIYLPEEITRRHPSSDQNRKQKTPKQSKKKKKKP